MPPVGSTMTCPTSPPIPVAPRYSRRPSTSPPGCRFRRLERSCGRVRCRAVPRPRRRRWHRCRRRWVVDWPSPGGYVAACRGSRCSAPTGYGRRASRRGRPRRHPIAAMSRWRARRSSTVSSRACSVSAVPPAGVPDAWTVSTISPSALTTPQAILLPPMSKPIAFGASGVLGLGWGVSVIGSVWRTTDGGVPS